MLSAEALMFEYSVDPDQTAVLSGFTLLQRCLKYSSRLSVDNIESQLAAEDLKMVNLNLEIKEIRLDNFSMYSPFMQL